MPNERTWSHEAFLSASPNFRLVGRKKVWCRVYEYLHARPPYRWEDERNGTIQPVAWRPEQRDFLVRADCGGRFVLVEQFYPGWIAACRAGTPGKGRAERCW
ncbi:MAG: hypothetical protein WBL65_16740 [Bryobacteraceae bacterium]